MARPKAEPKQQVRAWELYCEGLTRPKAITRRLEQEFDSPVSSRTVERWVKGFTGAADETRDLDSPFEWHRLEEYGLPWESGAFLLEMWRFWHTLRDFAQGYAGYGLPPATFRRARWWWRVRLAVPSEKQADIYFWAEAFVRQELFQDVLGVEADMASLEAYLAYHPWRDGRSYDLYKVAVFECTVKPLPSPFEDFFPENLRTTEQLGTKEERLRKTKKGADVGGTYLTSLHADERPSKRFFEEMKTIHDHLVRTGLDPQKIEVIKALIDMAKQTPDMEARAELVRKAETLLGSVGQVTPAGKDAEEANQ